MPTSATKPDARRAPLRILAVGAHPDDIEFGCGGVLLVEAARGSAISLLLCSRGEAGTHGTPDEREAETCRAAALLNAEVTFLGLGGDAHLEATNAHALTLARHLRRVRPDVLLAPTVEPNQHPDHAAVGSLCRDAARFARYGKVPELLDLLPPHAIGHLLHYAITPGAEPVGRPGVRVDISVQFPRWIELMECHATQMRTRRYVELQTARARVLGLEAGVEHAQALFPGDPFLVGSLAELPAAVRLF